MFFFSKPYFANKKSSKIVKFHARNPFNNYIEDKMIFFLKL